jgi:hypothetical protein
MKLPAVVRPSERRWAFGTQVDSSTHGGTVPGAALERWLSIGAGESCIGRPAKSPGDGMTHGAACPASGPRGGGRAVGASRLEADVEKRMEKEVRKRRMCDVPGCTRYLLDEQGRRVESPRLLLERARAVAESIVERPNVRGASVLDLYEDAPERAFTLSMSGADANHLRASTSDGDDGLPWGRGADGKPIDLVGTVGLCPEHAGQVARAYFFVRFLHAFVPTSHAPTFKTFYSMGTITRISSWIPYAGALLLMGRGSGKLSAEQFDAAIAGLRIYSSRVARALPVALFPSEATTISGLLRKSGPSPELERALCEVFSTALAGGDLAAAEEAASALDRVKKEFAGRRRAAPFTGNS